MLLESGGMWQSGVAALCREEGAEVAQYAIPSPSPNANISSVSLVWGCASQVEAWEVCTKLA